MRKRSMKKFGTPTVVGEKPSSAVASDAFRSVAGAAAPVGAGVVAGAEDVGAGVSTSG